MGRESWDSRRTWGFVGYRWEERGHGTLEGPGHLAVGYRWEEEGHGTLEGLGDLAVGYRWEEGDRRRGREGKRKKSNNPTLKGGEKTNEKHVKKIHERGLEIFGLLMKIHGYLWIIQR